MQSVFMTPNLLRLIYHAHTYNFALNERIKLLAADVIFVRKYKLHTNPSRLLQLRRNVQQTP